MQNLLFNLSALLALIPACVVGIRREGRRDSVFWLVWGVALAGAGAFVIAEMSGAWRTGFSLAMWVSVAVSVGIFVLVAAATAQAWRLAPLAAPYFLVIAALASIWHQASPAPLAAAAPTAWVHAHILVSVVTYGMVTVAAIAALGAFLQERALKNKKPTALTRRLPPVADCESLTVRLLAVGEGILALGLITGMGIEYNETGSLLVLDHKIVLTIGAFLVIGGLLIAHRVSGVRGRMAARVVLLAYLLLTLGYPGVKFVTDVLMSS